MLEKFRNNSFKNYGLCPSHYLSAPGLSWDDLLKMTKIELELIQILRSTYSLKKVQKVEFLILLINMAKRTINIYNL